MDVLSKETRMLLEAERKMFNCRREIKKFQAELRSLEKSIAKQRENMPKREVSPVSLFKPKETTTSFTETYLLEPILSLLREYEPFGLRSLQICECLEIQHVPFPPDATDHIYAVRQAIQALREERSIYRTKMGNYRVVPEKIFFS